MVINTRFSSVILRKRWQYPLVRPYLFLKELTWVGLWTESDIEVSVIELWEVLAHPFIAITLRFILIWYKNSIYRPNRFVWFVGFYVISTFVGYLRPNSFLCILSVLFKTIQFSISTLFNCHFYSKLLKHLYVTIHLSVNSFNIESSLSNNSVKHKLAV